MSLQKILAGLAARAPANHTLARGLYLRTERDCGAILLHAARAGAPPSPQELATLLSHWPAKFTLPVACTKRQTSRMTGYTVRLESPKLVFGQSLQLPGAICVCPACYLAQSYDYHCSGCGAALPASIQLDDDEEQF